MIIYTPDRVIYRSCMGGDEGAIHSARRKMSAAGPTYREVINGVSAQIVVDDGLGHEGYLDVSAGNRALVAEEGGVVIGVVMVRVSKDQSRWRAELDAWACPDKCHPDRPLDFVGDALIWLRSIGVTAAVTRAHLRASGDAPARVVKWAPDPIPEHPLGLPRVLTYDLR
ncbi:MAG: hypothetical protein OXI49_06800 [Acidobacteriota bacterium]|nr:hypothetical protein [Acidobacteriota bacterium]